MKTYIAKKVNSRMTFEDPRWEKCQVANLDMVWENDHPSPYVTTAKLVHSDEGVTVLMQTNEWPVYLSVVEHQGMVCVDSCMEFFFGMYEAGKESLHYLNIESNSLGVTFMSFGEGRHGRVFLDALGIERFPVSVHIGENGWEVFVFVPEESLKKVFASDMRSQKR